MESLDRRYLVVPSPTILPNLVTLTRKETPLRNSQSLILLNRCVFDITYFHNFHHSIVSYKRFVCAYKSRMYNR